MSTATFKQLAAAICLTVLASTLSSALPRSSAERARFRAKNPCPATYSTKGACPGYIIDHVQALCVGGKDKPANMHWMRKEQALLKDRWECKPGWQAKLADCKENGCFR